MTDFSETIRKTHGLISLLSRNLGITPGAVSQWRRVPAERVLEVERITGVSRHDIRPDIYPQATADASPLPSEAA